ncbi:MAG: hypothetical protein HRT80_10425 [Henriciella sp.]|nr:hypothetical protein [Henriciella sp.]
MGGRAIGLLGGHFPSADHDIVFVFRKDQIHFIGNDDGFQTASRFVDFAHLVAILFELDFAALVPTTFAAKGATFSLRYCFSFLFKHADRIGSAIDHDLHQMVGFIGYCEAGTGIGGRSPKQADNRGKGESEERSGKHSYSFPVEAGRTAKNAQVGSIKTAIVAVCIRVRDDDQLAISHFARIVFETGIVLTFADQFAVCVELNLTAIFTVKRRSKPALQG